MTLSPARPLSRNLLVAALAFAGTIGSFGFTTAPAEALSGHYYRAELATPVSEARSDIQKGVNWGCEGSVCVAESKGRSRDMIVCQRFTKEFGDVTAFRAGSKEFGEKQLAKCNG